MEGLIALAILMIIIIVIIINCIKIVPQAHAMVIERLGGYLTTWSVGLHFKVPFIDRIAKKVILKEGDIVRQGQVIAKVGNSGNTNGPHIHFQIQDRLDSKNAKGIKINFKNIKIRKNNRYIHRRYIKHGYTVENK